MEVAGLAAAFLLRVDFGRWCLAYALLMIAYSLLLKRIPFLEALIVAAGMPLRALAGAALAGVEASNFLLICAYLLALFLVAGKRQWEFHNAGERSSFEHRPALAAYRAEGLDYLFIVTGLTTVSAYSAYSVLSTTAAHYGQSLAATVPFVVLGLARYHAPRLPPPGEGAVPPRPSSSTTRGFWSSSLAGWQQQDGSSMVTDREVGGG